MRFIFKVILTMTTGYIILIIPIKIYLCIFLITGFVSWEFIIMLLFGKIEIKFKEENKLKDLAIRFNDIEDTEIYLTDIKGYRYALLLDKGYVIDIVTDSKEAGLWMYTLRYGSRSERDKDHKALIYKLKEYGLYTERTSNEQRQ